MEIRQTNSKKNKFVSNTKKKDISFFKKEKTRSYKENFIAGDILTVKITALGSKNIGVAELKNGYTLLVPNTKCGEKVQVKIEKVFSATSSSSFLKNGEQQKKSNQKIKYAVASLINQASNETINGQSSKSSNSVKFDFKVGQKFKVTIAKKGPKHSGFVPLSKNFLLVVPNVNVGEKVFVEIQKIKQNYAFATPVRFQNSTVSERGNFFNEKSKQMGQQFHIILPSSAKTIANYFVVKLNGNLIFVKKGLGVQLGDTVKIQIQKSTETFKIAKILKISPISKEEKKLMVKQIVQKMIQSSMHFGEKAIRCNANMRKYIWYRKKNFGFTSFLLAQTKTQKTKKPLVKRGRHILNVLKTQRCLNLALKQLAKYAAKGKTFLFVGTKKSAASLVAKTALLSNTSFFVNTRWLGGMLTNWKTILKSISQIRPILKQKQKILQKILEKRQKIQRRLFNKVYLLRKKSQKFMIKGKYLIRQILHHQSMTSQNGLNYFQEQSNSTNFLIERSHKLLQRKNEILSSNVALVNASKNLKYKKLQTFKQIQDLEMAAFEILKQKQQLKSLMITNIKKFREFEQLFGIGQELINLKNSFEKNNGKKFVAISYEKFKTIGRNEQQWNIPNPSPEIFKKMISLLSTLRKENLNVSLSLPSFAHLLSPARPLAQRAGGGECEEVHVSVHGHALSSPSLSPCPKGKGIGMGMGDGLSNRAKSSETLTNSNQTVILSKFLNKFLLFLPFLKTSMEILTVKLNHQQKLIRDFDLLFNQILEKQNLLNELYKKIVSQLNKVSLKFSIQTKNFKTFQTNLKQLASEQRLLKFLPKLRYLPTSQTKMYETIELFMKKFVDPKLIYPMKQIYDQKLKFTSKKIATTRKQKWQRLEKYFGGITKMAKMNAKQISKNIAIIVGQQEEMNAVHECRKLGMKIFAVVDTNCNPKYADYIIPANDDSRNSIKYILGEMLTYIRLGQKLRKKVSFRAKARQNLNKRRRF